MYLLFHISRFQAFSLSVCSCSQCLCSLSSSFWLLLFPNSATFFLSISLSHRLLLCSPSPSVLFSMPLSLASPSFLSCSCSQCLLSLSLSPIPSLLTHPRFFYCPSICSFFFVYIYSFKKVAL